MRLKLNKNWIPVWLKKPTDFRPTTKMPNFRLTDEQIKTISAYIWQSGLTDPLPKHSPGNAAHGKELFETRGCLACHSIGEGDQMQGGIFAANLTRVGEKDNYEYLVRWVHNARERTRPYCLFEKKDIGPEDYQKKGLPFVFDLEHTRCPNDGHELQVQNMTVMPSLRLSPQDAEDVASYLITLKKQEPSSYPEATFMDDPNLREEGKRWIRHYGCAGCHEISGLEDEGRIGTELTFEGSKPVERLDFALLTEVAQRGGSEPITDPDDLARLPEGPAKQPWYGHKGFFEHKLAEPNIWDKGKIKPDTEKLRMPNMHLTKEQIRASHYISDGQSGEPSTCELSVPSARLSPRHSRGVVGRQEVQLYGLPSASPGPAHLAHVDDPLSGAGRAGTTTSQTSHRRRTRGSQLDAPLPGQSFTE